MSRKGRCSDKCIGRTVAYLLHCPRSTVPEVMQACKFTDKESKDVGKHMAVHRADSNTTTNQQRDQQKWEVVVAVIVTAKAPAMTATRQRDGNDATTNQQRDQQKWAVVVVAIATATAAAMTVTTATTATQQRSGDATETVMDSNGWCDDNATATTVMEGVTATQQQWNVMRTMMDGATAMEMAT